MPSQLFCTPQPGHPGTFDVPPISDTLPGYETSSFYGVGAPHDTPKDIVDLLNKEINAGLKDAKLRDRLIELGSIPLGGTPAEFGALLSDAIDKWAKVIKFAGIKAE